MEQQVVNRVAKSALVSIDIDEYIDESERSTFDLAQGLFQGMILKEKEFRAFVKGFDWEGYRDKNVNVHCSADAIIPTWAYMLVASKLQPVCSCMVLGDEEDLEKKLIDQAVDDIMAESLDGAKVVIKGCGGIKCRDYAYFRLTERLIPVVSSMMYGEPCSTVPVYKKPKETGASK